MKLSNKNIKRIAVFIFYDKDNIVDDYVLYILDSLKSAVDDIIITSNSDLSFKEKEKFAPYTDKLVIRENVGFDIGAFSEIYLSYKNYIKDFDELVVLNDTFYGPFKPFKVIFDEMAHKDVDFWGLGANYNSVDGYGYLPDNMIHSHVQSYFMVFRSSLLKSKVFNDYWKKYNIYEMNSFNAVVTKHELAFTYFLEQNGFKWDIYSNLNKYKSDDINANFNCYAYAGFEMIKNLNFPILKRKNLIFNKRDALFLTDGADARRSIDYINKEKLYNTDLIWKNIIRLYKPEDIYYGLDLNFILDTTHENDKKNNKNYIVILNLNDEALVQRFIELIKGIPKEKIGIISLSHKIIDEFSRLNIMIIDKDNFNNLDYDYMCLINDTYLKTQKIPTVFENNLLNIMENGLENIESIINVFKNNKYVGLLLLPPNYYSTYFDELSDCNNVIPANNNCCWIKSELFSWKIFESYDFVKQHIKNIKNYGYVVGKIYSINTANYNLINQEKIIKDILYYLKFYNNVNTPSYSELLCFLKNYQNEKICKINIRKIWGKLKKKIFK